MSYITDNRGQVGIGTLIVFIALVLVAAIAAGVLINTAGFLQTQAEETGEDSTEQVADNINLIGEVGEVAEFVDQEDLSTNGEERENFVHEVRLTVQRSAGSGDIDLTGLSIQYVGDNGFAQLIHTSDVDEDFDGDVTSGVESDTSTIVADADRSEAAYLVEEITAESGDDAVLTDDGDRYEIIIPLATAKSTGDIGIADEEVLDGELDGITVPVNAEDTNNADDTSGLAFDDVVAGSDVRFDNLDLGLLQEGQDAELEITTDAGATRNAAVSVPDSLVNEEGRTVTL